MGLILRESKIEPGSINLSATAEAGKVPGRGSNRTACTKVARHKAKLLFEILANRELRSTEQELTTVKAENCRISRKLGNKNTFRSPKSRYMSVSPELRVCQKNKIRLNSRPQQGMQGCFHTDCYCLLLQLLYIWKNCFKRRSRTKQQKRHLIFYRVFKFRNSCQRLKPAKIFKAVTAPESAKLFQGCCIYFIFSLISFYDGTKGFKIRCRMGSKGRNIKKVSV